MFLRHSGQVRVLDLFSGIGGFSLGLERAGMRTVAFCEIDPYCRAVLRRHWPSVPCFEDVRAIDRSQLGAIDLVCGGYPCQPFSLAGKRAGEADDRHLWPYFAGLVRDLRPAWVLAENVVGHVTMGLDQVLADLEGLGYAATSFVIPACATGAPHRRDRLWIVANAGRDGLQGQRSGGDSGGQAFDDPRGEATGVPDADGADADGWKRSFGWPAGRMGWSESLSRDGDWEIASEPFVRRGTHGIPNRMDRIRALGNAVVPEIPYRIGRAIMSADCCRGDLSE
jgi:DNA (cytosine-5)-methyltransferase 1